MDIEEDLECKYTTLETKEKGLRGFRFLISKKTLIKKQSFFVNEDLPKYYWTKSLYQEFDDEQILEQLRVFRRKLFEQKRIHQLQDSAKSKIETLEQFLKEADIVLSPTNRLTASPKTVKKQINVDMPKKYKKQIVQGTKSQAIQTFDLRFNTMQEQPDKRHEICNQLIVELQKISNFESGHNQFNK